MQSAVEKADVNILPPARRWSGIYTLALMSLLLLFFVLHQKENTGFFTTKFGPLEMLALYGPILASMIAPALRLYLGRVEPARLVEAVSDVCLAVGSWWLRVTFPFNFANIGNLFPENMRIAFLWLNDNVGRIILLLQIIIGFVSALATLSSYLTERRKPL